MSANILKLENITKIYDSGIGVKNINLEIKEGEVLALVGESGSGKSTIARLIVGLLKKDKGEVFFKNINISDSKKNFKHKIQMIFQSPYSSLNPRYKVREIISEGIKYQKILPKGQKLDDYLISLLTEVGLNENILERYPSELSGGQRQRIGIARALAVKPEIIIADECLSALDTLTQKQILELLKKIREERKLTCIFISHDLSFVKKISDRVVVLKDGEIVEISSKEEIFKEQKHEYTRELFKYILDLKLKNF
ncbi:MAG: ATP-binding cassette domain-containing protein [Fusobacterium sp.]|uniref:ABC transporter ATP-binding protein n=1 Tax=Fusobacterium sp. TaxID=68766 RepID=UPI0026DCCD4D|nr:ATP-binding cassette domain-containing protein [Fusobacterium sp.]MDO4690298.1 ATP-binding cassette domain-containing protein [Fusobacterium sp.]